MLAWNSHYSEGTNYFGLTNDGHVEPNATSGKTDDMQTTSG